MVKWCRLARCRWWVLFVLSGPYGYMLAMALWKVAGFARGPSRILLAFAGAVLGCLWWVFVAEVAPETEPPGVLLDGEVVWSPWVVLAGTTVACLLALAWENVVHPMMHVG